MMKKVEKHQKQGFSRQPGRLKESVTELHERMDRVDSVLDNELSELCKSRVMDTRVGSSSEVYRDKNTLVEVTIHRRPKGVAGRVEGRNSAPEAGKVETRGKRATSQSERRGPSERKRNVGELLAELKELVADSGVNEVRQFLEGLDPGVAPQSSRKAALSQVQDHRKLESQLTKLKAELEKQKAEATRYKHEHAVVSKQAEIRRVDQESLEVQIVDLKKIVSRLTKNNSELLSIVAEKINYEEKIAGLEARASQLAQQVGHERSRAEETERKLAIAQREGAALRAVAADLRAGLQHGLAGLDSARPVSALSNKGNKTKEILGASVLQPSTSAPAVQARADSDDSAIEDPNSESLKSYRRAQGVVKPANLGNDVVVERNADPESARIEDRWAGLSHTPPTKQHRRRVTNPAPIDQFSTVSQATVDPPAGKTVFGNHVLAPPSSQFRVEVLPTSGDQVGNKGRGGLSPDLVPLQRAISAPPLASSAFPHPIAQQFSAPPSSVRQVENLLPTELQRAGSRSSTLLASSTQTPDFQPAALELSETQSITETDGIASNNLSSQQLGKNEDHGDLKHANPSKPAPSSKGSLENKVANFLHRLQQDTINLSLDLPQAREFAGPSMHLSLSGSDLGEGELTTNTTLTEGKFLRGLETSIEVLNQAESSHSDVG